ncbi:MAG: hypothetical protein WKH64_16670 [Chloroflexia bacterium]
MSQLTPQLLFADARRLECHQHFSASHIRYDLADARHRRKMSDDPA